MYGFALVRYNADGTLDRILGGGTGVVITPMPGNPDTLENFEDSAYALVLQENGALVAADVPSQFALVFYNSEGTLVRNFLGGGTGTVTTGVSGVANALIQQTDGKLVAAGFILTNVSTGYNFAVVRYNVDGTLDTTFGQGTGMVTIPAQVGIRERLLCGRRMGSSWWRGEASPGSPSCATSTTPAATASLSPASSATTRAPTARPPRVVPTRTLSKGPV